MKAGLYGRDMNMVAQGVFDELCDVNHEALLSHILRMIVTLNLFGWARLLGHDFK